MSVMNQDGILHISLLEGQARAILTESTQVVQRAKDIHARCWRWPTRTAR